MFRRKEYKCYRGQEIEECCQQRVDEAVRHRTYLIILIISVALMILALTIKTADSTEFVGQVSFASTVTSIILSVIAIWMSITGERSTNEIRNKIADATVQLSKTTSDAKDVNEKFKAISDMQMEGFQQVAERMNEVLEKMDIINANTSMIKEHWLTKSEALMSDERVVFRDSEILKYIELVRKLFPGPNSRYLLDRVIEYTLECGNIGEDENAGKKFYEYFEKCLDKTEFEEKAQEGMRWAFSGVFNCLRVIGYSDSVKEQIREITKETKR